MHVCVYKTPSNNIFFERKLMKSECNIIWSFMVEGGCNTIGGGGFASLPDSTIQGFSLLCATNKHD